MSEGYVKRLLNPLETLNVLRELPILTGDHRKDTLEPKVRGLGAYESVKGPARICYYDLRVDAIPSRNLMLHLEDVQASATLKTGMFKKAKTLRACYYLPYRRNGTTRMKLSPDAAYVGDPPRFFATAAIDGCSVYVEGPPDTPKVSHLNASNVAPAPVTITEQKAESDLNRQNRIQQKINDMDARMNVIKKGQTHVAERPHYIEDFAPGKTLMKQQFANKKGITLAAVTDYQPFGAVIGIMNNDAWTFYLQKCGNFTFKLSPQSKSQSELMVMSADEFWPTNVGGVRVF